MLRGLPYLMLVAAAVVVGCPAAETNAPAPPQSEAMATNLPLREVSPGVFELGLVRLDKRQRTVTFPAVLNLDNGVLEYLLVTGQGKTHESLLRTEARPHHVHVAMLLLGAKGAGTNSWPEEAGQSLPGDPLRIEVIWKAGGREHRRLAEDLIWNRRTRSPLRRGAWVYSGARVEGGRFVAEDLGSIVSLITDPDALINNGGPGREDDEIWQTRTKELPPLEAPVQVQLRLETTK